MLKYSIGLMRSAKNRSIILLVILSLGLFLRIYDLGDESIWLDEGNSIMTANLNSFHQMIKQVANDSEHPPLHYIILHYWINLFGDSEFSTRFLSVIYSFFALFMIYKVATLIFNKNIGILSCLLLALSRFHIHYSQEVRSYSLMTLLALLSIYFFIRLMEKVSFKVSIGYIIFSTLLIYTHYFSIFIILAQNVYIFTLSLLSRRKCKLNFRVWLLFQGILIILYMPWINTFINRTFRNINVGYSWRPVPTINSIIDSFLVYSGSFYIAPIFLILCLFSMITYKEKGRINRVDSLKFPGSHSGSISLSSTYRIYLLFVWLLTPIILPFVISKFQFLNIYITRYTIAASLAFYILVAKGIENINNKFIKSVIIILIIVFSLGNIKAYYTEFIKGQEWREATNYIDIKAKKEDILLFHPDYCQKYGFDYYSKRTDLNKKEFPKLDKVYIDMEQIGSTIEGYNRVWIILYLSKECAEPIKKMLNSEFYSLSYYKRYTGAIEVYLFEKINKYSILSDEVLLNHG